MEMLEIGDLVRHIEDGSLGIIIDTTSTLPEVRIRWLTDGWCDQWTLTQNVEKIDQ